VVVADEQSRNCECTEEYENEPCPRFRDGRWLRP